MKKRILCLLLVMCLLPTFSVAHAAPVYSDVPAGDWSETYIEKATELGIINGYGDNRFGYGDSVTRAQFAAMLVRLFAWELSEPEKASFTDNADKSAWYYKEVEAAVKNGAVSADTSLFRPNDNITREEMAVMLVRALGYSTLSGQLSGISLPFTDVSSNKAYIAMAYDFGIINGVSATKFAPGSDATREQAAAMMIRLYERHMADGDFLHAFYAISSYSQRQIIPKLDAVSFGWSSLEYVPDTGVLLNTTKSASNTYGYPDGYQEVIDLARSGGTAANLSVYMSASQAVTMSDGSVSNPCVQILTSSENRAAAIKQIVSELTRTNNFAGVTIDFEEMKGDALKSGMNAFLRELHAELSAHGKTLYVCVHPQTSDMSYYDAYDYREIGKYADKVILMAHDYAAKKLTDAEMESGFVWTPVSPIHEVYYALRALTAKDTGVEDYGKALLAISFNSVQWERKNGKVINSRAYQPTPESIYNRVRDVGTTLNYSERYENPYYTYISDTGTEYTTWYEDERSVAAKEKLAHMFGITGVSVWRLGIIPDYDSAVERNLYYNVLGSLLD